MAKRRTRYEIYSDLLDVVARRGTCRLTRASYGANLPVDRAKDTLAYLAIRGFVKEESVDDSKIFKITKRGMEYLETFKKMRKLFAALDEEMPSAQLHARLVLGTKEINQNDILDLTIELSNRGEGSALLQRLEKLFPSNFELVKGPEDSRFENQSLELNGRRLRPSTNEKISFRIKPLDKGTFSVQPKVIFIDGTGPQKSCEPKPEKVVISEPLLPDRIATGYTELDSLLFGGLPVKYAVILTSVSCDERDLLIKSFLEAGAKAGEVTFHITIEATGIKRLVKQFSSNFHLFLSNPQADTIIKDSHNVYKTKGVENLTEINISLASAFRKLSKSGEDRRRVCIDIVSDVLLHHHAVQTRRWLTGLIPELKSKGFTALAVMNPRMHRAEEVQAILGLFDGEIRIYDKETDRGMRKHLRIMKMLDSTYSDKEIILEKEKLRL